MSDVDPNSSSHRTYPLAFDANGEPLDVPSHAVAWRVRKLAKKAGRPKVIFDAETGRPLEKDLRWPKNLKQLCTAGHVCSRPESWDAIVQNWPSSLQYFLMPNCDATGGPPFSRLLHCREKARSIKRLEIGPPSRGGSAARCWASESALIR